MVSDSLTGRPLGRLRSPFVRFADADCLPELRDILRIEPSSLGTAGRTVRCVRCRSVWFAYESTEFPATAEHVRDDGRATAALFVEPDDARNPKPPLAAGYDPAASRYETKPALEPSDGGRPPLPAHEFDIFTSESGAEDTPTRPPEPASGGSTPVPLADRRARHSTDRRRHARRRTSKPSLLGRVSRKSARRIQELDIARPADGDRGAGRGQ